MSRENVELVRSLYPTGGLDWAFIFATAERKRAFWGQVAPLLHPDYHIVWMPSGERGETAPTAADFPSHLGAMRVEMDHFDRYEFKPELFLDLGDRVLVLERLTMRRPEDATDTQAETATIYEIADGLVRTAAFYVRRSDALAAVGMRADDVVASGEPARLDIR